MDVIMRRLVADDAEAARRLGEEAFGVPVSRPPVPATVDRPGTTWFGAFHRGELVARTIDRAYEAWFGGVAVPTCGVAGVTVAAEARGRGLLTPLMVETLQFARSRGAVISTLFPTAPRIYRRFGYEVIADLLSVEVPTAALASVLDGGAGVRTAALSTRRATAADFDAIRTVYDTWAMAQNGPLTRRGASFTASAEDFLDSFTGVTVVVDAAGTVCGYVSWERGQGYGEHATIEVSDLLATTSEGYRALIAVIGSFSSVTARTRIETSGDDLIRLFLPALDWKVVHASPYMLAILDVPGALELRRYPPGLQARISFSVRGHALPDVDGSYVAEVSGGRAECRRGPADDRVLTPQGLALLYAGAQSCANLRAAGHLTGGSVTHDQDLDAMFGGRQRHIRDYF